MTITRNLHSLIEQKDKSMKWNVDILKWVKNGNRACPQKNITIPYTASVSRQFRHHLQHNSHIMYFHYFSHLIKRIKTGEPFFIWNLKKLNII